MYPQNININRMLGECMGIIKTALACKHEMHKEVTHYTSGSVRSHNAWSL